MNAGERSGVPPLSPGTSAFSAAMLACAPRELIVTADDLGYSAERDAGIFAAFRDGVVTQASLMINGTTAAEAAAEAGRIGLSLGLHANITEGSPVAAPNDVRILLAPRPDARGRAVFRGKHGLRTFCAAAVKGEAETTSVAAVVAAVEAELGAQLDRFVELTGRPATHADGHQHVHVLPLLAPIFARIMASHGVRRTRLPTERVTCFPWTPGPVAAFYAAVAADAEVARAVFAAEGIVGSDHFVGMSLTGSDGSTAALCHALHLGAPLQRAGLVGAEQRVVTVELMVHPGFTTPSAAPQYEGGALTPTLVTTTLVTADGVPDDFSRSADRELELALLTRPATSAALEELGFALTTFAASRGIAQAVAALEPAIAAAASSAAPPVTGAAEAAGSEAAGAPLDVLLLASLSPATGNYHTVMRLMRLFTSVPRVRHVRAMWSAHATEPLLCAAARRLGIGLLVGLHAYRAGSLLLRCPVPFVLVLGGTDVMAMGAMGGPEGARGAVMLRAARAARRLVAFSTEMVSGLGLLERTAGGGDEEQRIVPVIIPQAVVLPECVCAAAVRGSIGEGWSLRTRLGLRPDAWLLLLPLGLRPVKDPRFLIDVMAAWHEREPRAHLLLVGPALDAACSTATLGHLGLLAGSERTDGTAMPTLPTEEESAAQLRATGVSFLGPLPRRHLLLGMWEASAVVNCSVSEGMSNSLLEAMAVGRGLK